MIACTIVCRLFKQKHLGASFLFLKNDEDVNTVGKFFISLIMQFVYIVLSFQTHIRDTVKEQNNIASLFLMDQ